MMDIIAICQSHVLIFLIMVMQNKLVENVKSRVITTLNYSKYRVKTTIVNGEVAGKGEIPYLVSFKATQVAFDNITGDGGNVYLWDSLCGGSIIHPSEVLTAAHCFELDNFFLAKHTSALRVVAGSLQTATVHTGITVTRANEQWRGVKRIRMHEYFHFPDNDIAIVTVDVPYIFNAYVSPIRYTRTAVDYPEVCRAAGYGDQSNISGKEIRSPVLLVALIKPMPRWQCSGLWEMDMSTYVCTDSVTTDVSVGDSGGPLACTGTLDPNEEPGKEILLGIVSGKNTDKTTLFTRVSAYKGWIEAVSQTCEKRRVITTLKYVAHRMKPVIVNGSPALLGSVPYIVSITEPTQTGWFSYDYKNLCAGTIVNTRKVLTAAHCFEGNKFKYAKDPSSLRVIAGDTRSVVPYSKMAAESQWRRISIVVIHPYFNFPLDDIALVFGTQDWYFTKYVSNIQLASIQMDYPDSCYIAGYGRTGHKKGMRRSPVLLVAKIDILPRNNCTEVWEMNMDEFVCSRAVTADVSYGDSGGPLTCRGTREAPDKELLIGVTSGKNFDKTTLFTRVSAYLDWIEESNRGRNLKNRKIFTYLLICLLNIKCIC